MLVSSFLLQSCVSGISRTWHPKRRRNPRRTRGRLHHRIWTGSCISSVRARYGIDYRLCSIMTDFCSFCQCCSGSIWFKLGPSYVGSSPSRFVDGFCLCYGLCAHSSSRVLDTHRSNRLEKNKFGYGVVLRITYRNVLQVSAMDSWEYLEDLYFGIL